MTEPFRAVLEVEVRYAETDQMGVVHHANYLIWFEQARTALCRESGFHYAEIEESGYLMMVTGTEVEHRRGVRYGDTVAVNCWIDSMRSRTIHFAYQVLRGGEIAATGRTAHVWIRSATRQPCRVPPYLVEPFARLAGQNL
jgi:acyl-CoA thioester hydrolase